MKHAYRMLTLILWLLAVAVLENRACAQDYPGLPEIDPADLGSKMRPGSPGGPAVILYYAEDTDDIKSTETASLRIKILNDEGKKYADVEIPYVEKYSEVVDIRARTIGPDGKVTTFADQVFDRDIVNARKYRFHAKVLTLANVQVGSIIEYTYRKHYKEKVPPQFQHPEHFVFDRGTTYPAANWYIQRELFLRHGHFTLTPANTYSVRAFSPGHAELQPTRLSDGRMQLDVDNIPAYQQEEYSPPEDDLKMRMNLYYAEGFYQPDGYWLGLARTFAKGYDEYIGKSKVVAAEAARVVSPSDTPETKLKKLYARVQQIRELDYESAKGDKQRKQEQLKGNKNIEEVLTRGYGSGHEVNFLFIGLARAAGFHAYPMSVASRRKGRFWPDYPNYEQLDSMLVAVVLNNKYVYLDPETRFCPYGVLPWEETGTGGIIVDAINGQVGTTPLAPSLDAVKRTTAELQLSPEGDLKGKVKISYAGQEALVQRRGAIGADETARREHLEESLKGLLAQGATVKLLSADGWEKTEEPLTAEFEIEVPNYATHAGRRLLLPLGVLHATEKNPFPSAIRTHPLYFDYPYESYENVRIELPTGLQVDGLPEGKKIDKGAIAYELAVKKEDNALKVTRMRRLTSAGVASVDQYPTVRAYFDVVLAGDSLQANLKPMETVQAK